MSAATRFERSIPILRVRRLRESVRWFCEVLGFSVDWSAPLMASVSCDGSAVMLCEDGQGHLGGWVWFGVEDAAPLFEACHARGADVVMRPTNFSWAYEFRLRDPDGNVLRFGSDPRKDLPIQDHAGDEAGEGGANE